MSSRFEPHIDSIEEMFRLGYSYRKIAKTLADQHGLVNDPAGLFRWWRNNIAKRAQRAAMLVPVTTPVVIQAQPIPTSPIPQRPPTPQTSSNASIPKASQEQSDTHTKEIPTTLKRRIPPVSRIGDKREVIDRENMSPEDVLNLKKGMFKK